MDPLWYLGCEELAYDLYMCIVENFEPPPESRSFARLVEHPDWKAFKASCCCDPSGQASCWHEQIYLGDFLDEDVMGMLREVLSQNYVTECNVMSLKFMEAEGRLIQAAEEIILPFDPHPPIPLVDDRMLSVMRI